MHELLSVKGSGEGDCASSGMCGYIFTTLLFPEAVQSALSAMGLFVLSFLNVS